MRSELYDLPKVYFADTVQARILEMATDLVKHDECCRSEPVQFAVKSESV